MGTGSGTNFFTTPSLGLRQPIPGVCGALGVEPPGTSWLELINGSLGTLDQHTHSPGSGSPVPTAGLNINADLPFGGFNATGLRSARFAAQGSPLALPTDLGCLYFSGVDAYVNDLNGNQIRLTSAGAIAGTPGSISGLVSPAAASYTPASKLFAFSSSSGFAANLSCGPVSIGDSQNSGGKACTLQVPTGLASNYNLTLPAALPGSNGLLGISTSGQLSTFGVTSGSNLTLAGTLTVAGQISGVTDPTSAQQAATKNYVDTASRPVAVYSGNQSLAHGAGATIVNFSSQAIDTNGAVTPGAGWVFTVPAGQGGNYRVELFGDATGVTWAIGDTVSAALFKNLSTNLGTLAAVVAWAATNYSLYFAASVIVALIAGDTISIKGTAGTASVSPTFSGTVSISKVGT